MLARPSAPSRGCTRDEETFRSTTGAQAKVLSPYTATCAEVLDPSFVRMTSSWPSLLRCRFLSSSQQATMAIGDSQVRATLTVMTSLMSNRVSSSPGTAPIQAHSLHLGSSLDLRPRVCTSRFRRELFNLHTNKHQDRENSGRLVTQN